MNRKDLFACPFYFDRIELDTEKVSNTIISTPCMKAMSVDENILETNFKFLYEDEVKLWDKMETIAKKIYGASSISAPANVRKQIEDLQENGYGNFPVCVAKTQYSFSTDPTLRGAPTDHEIPIREVRLSAGAEFIVMVCGDIMTMPGLPKVPAAERIDIDDNGNIVGLF